MYFAGTSIHSKDNLANCCVIPGPVFLPADVLLEVLKTRAIRRMGKNTRGDHKHFDFYGVWKPQTAQGMGAQMREKE